MEEKKKYSLLDYLKSLGPGAIVVATIIGPGTVTTCTLAGVNYKYALIWAAIFAVIAAAILQLISTRIGIASGKGLAVLIHDEFKGTPWAIVFAVIVTLCIGLGNTAFECGNFSGAVLGIRTIIDLPTWLWATILAVIVFILVWIGKYKIIEKFMTALVFIMCVMFLITAIAVKPNLGEIFKGMVPNIPKGAALVAMGVVGTTVIPNLLFMHSQLSATKWDGKDKDNALRESTFDTIFNMIMAAVITISVIITGATLYNSGITISSGADMAKQLEPLLGSWAKYVFGFGLFGAGITSALSGPISAAYAIGGILGWKVDLKSWKYRIIYIIVILFGFIATATGKNPVTIILLAQTFNGIMLPLSAGILMIGANRKVLGKYKNNIGWNIAGFVVIALTIALAARTLYQVLPKLFG